MAPAIEDTMFFPRLRRHAKWMFVFLALVFAVGFVGFGVGAGGTGVGDIFRGDQGSSGVPSVSEARKQTEETPKNAQAWRDLSTALQTEGETDEAIAALTTYTTLKPKDVDGLRELVGLYLASATAKGNAAQEIQLQAAFAGASQNFPGSLSVNGTSIVDNKIGRRSTPRRRRITAASPIEQAARARHHLRDRRAQPNDLNVGSSRIDGQQMQNSSRDQGVRAFLVLAPDDPNASIVKTQLNAEETVSASASG
jgi:hypothetical protein